MNSHTTSSSEGMCLLWLGLVGFYGISTIIGYLMPNPVYTFTLIYIVSGIVIEQG